MDRRHFFTALASLGAVCATGKPANASNDLHISEDRYGVLTDITKCIGCRKCEWACNETNHLPTQTLESFEDRNILEIKRRPDAEHYTVVNQYQFDDGEALNVKFQCMHCDHPACYSACLVTAFSKDESGAVVYDAWRCLGCRYCMMACPFQIPAYEYDNPLTPKVQKCTLCFDRIKEEGQVPACIEVCPTQCLTFAKRKDLLEVAHDKINSHPESYVDHVYGEHEVGGTSWMYIASKPFDELGLPVLPEKAPPKTTESIQHGIFRYFVPPIALFSVLGFVSQITKPEQDTQYLPEKPLNSNETSMKLEPAKEKFFTPGVYVLLVFIAAGLASALWRFIFGIGAITNLDDQYPWGIWIALDVATGVALAAGGFTTAALIYIFNNKRYKPLMRSALLTAMLGYTFVELGLLVDLGRYYNIWHPIVPFMWSSHSVLFEVGMCVMFYVTVLYLEFMPIVVERFHGRVDMPGILRRLNRPVDSLLGFMGKSLRKIMLILIIFGVVLSCLHQSSLGALMLIVPTKMHALWYTPIMPLLFLLSAFAVGYPMVIFVYMIAKYTIKQKPEMELLSPLSKIIPVMLLIYFGFKLGDLVIRDQIANAFAFDLQSIMFLIEVIIGVVIPIVMLSFAKLRWSPLWLFVATTLVVVGVAINRFNVFITAYTPVYEEGIYIPAVGEVLITTGLIAGLLLVYRTAVIIFPILPSNHVKTAQSTS